MRYANATHRKTYAPVSGDNSGWYDDPGKAMDQSIEERLSTLMGQYAVLNEVVIALLAATPNRDSVLRLAVRNAGQLREEAVQAGHSSSWVAGVAPDSAHLDAWCTGVDLEIANYKKLLVQFAEKKPGK